MTTNTTAPAISTDALAAGLAEALATAYADRRESIHVGWGRDARAEARATFDGVILTAVTLFPSLSRTALLFQVQQAADREGTLPVHDAGLRRDWITGVAAETAASLRVYLRIQ
jgi:hypothetical protein